MSRAGDGSERSKALSRVSPHTRRRRRTFALGAAILAAFGTVAGQLVHFGLAPGPVVSLAAAKPIGRSWARPDIVDRRGRILATDIVTPSLFADPSLLVDVDEVVEFLNPIFPDLNWDAVRRRLEDRARRFVWIKRGITPKTAQRIHNLGLPGLAFRDELRRVYPAANTASHMLGFVDIDNRGQAGIEKFVDDVIGVDPVDGAGRSEKAPVRLTIDIGVQHALRAELLKARKRYRASAAAGLILDVRTGGILAAVSVPDFNPNKAGQVLEAHRLDRLSQGRYELGSVFKPFTLAAAFDLGIATPRTSYDARRPLRVGGYVINDLHPARRWLTAEQVFLQSSNIGTALIGIEIGKVRLLEYLDRFGLVNRIETEAGRVTPPQLPVNWQDVHTMTVAYGHGIAVTPLQFAAAAAALVNGGRRVYPRFVEIGQTPEAEQVIHPRVSRMIRRLLRLNVASATGTGRRAEVPGYQVGGKTGTADQPGKSGYTTGKVISSFVAAFPSGDPRYLTYVLLFEPQPTKASNWKTTAGLTAAPLTAEIIKRTAPMLGIAPSFPDSDS